MISVDAFSELLQVLYSAPLDQEQWQRFLTLVSEHTKSSSGFFISASDESRLRVLAAGGSLAIHHFVASYNAEYAQTDPFRSAAVRRAAHREPVGVYSEAELLPGDQLLETPLYQQLLAPTNLRYAAIMIMNLSVRRLDAISLWRTPDDGPVTTDCRQLLELLLPHLQTALEVTRQLRLGEHALASTEIMANASATATFIVDCSGHVRHCNASAEMLLHARDGLLCKNGRLLASTPEGAQSLERLLKASARTHSSVTKPRRVAALLIPRQSRKRPLNLVAMPLPERQRVSAGGDVLVVVSDPDAPVRTPGVFLRDLHGFTPTEIEVASGLMIGYSTEEIARLRRVSIGTVRQQIKGMLAKTGTTRQVEMVRLFLSLPAVSFEAGDLP